MNNLGTLTLLGIMLASFAVAWLCVAALRRWAAQRLLDLPNARSSHTRPTPRGGGLVIVLVILGGLLGAYFVAGMGDGRVLVCYGTGALVIAAISWLDDLRGVANRLRFAVHFVGAALLVAGGWWATGVTLPGGVVLPFGLLGIPLTLFWVVGLTNAYNFMDGIDGLAGGQAAIAGGAWAVWGMLTNDPWSLLLGTLLAGSSLGFLAHNWPPARIFMGDVGSAFLGYTVAALPLVAARRTPTALLAGVLIVWPFLWDAGFTFLRRWRRGENVWAAHRSHLYQRLVIAGWSHRRSTLLYLGLALTGAAAALLLRGPAVWAWLGMAVIAVAALGLLRLVWAVE